MHSHPGCWPEKTTSDVWPAAGKDFQYDGVHKSGFSGNMGLLAGAEEHLFGPATISQSTHSVALLTIHCFLL